MTGPDVELRVPAQTAYVAVLRSTAAALAARLDFTLDDMEDLRIAVGEACAMVLTRARDTGSMTAGFELAGDRMRITVTADAEDPGEPDRDGFAWQVLSALVSEASATTDAGRVAISLSVTSELAGATS